MEQFLIISVYLRLKINFLGGFLFKDYRKTLLFHLQNPQKRKSFIQYYKTQELKPTREAEKSF